MIQMLGGEVDCIGLPRDQRFVEVGRVCDALKQLAPTLIKCPSCCVEDDYLSQPSSSSMRISSQCNGGRHVNDGRGGVP